MSNFLNIEQKEDSAQKLAAAQGKPTKHFLFANELNSIVDHCNTLRSLILINSINIEAILTVENSVELGTIVDESFIGVLDSSEIRQYISPVFVRYMLNGITYVQAFVGQRGIYGYQQKQFVESDFILIYQSDNAPVIIPVDSRPYKVYTALLTQAGNFDPSAIVLENTLGVLIRWTYEDVGFYRGSSSNTFTYKKTICFNNITNGNSQVVLIREAADKVILVSRDCLGNATNGNVNGMSIEIRVYN